MVKWLNSIYTDGSKYFVSNPLPKKGEEIEILIRVLNNKRIKKVLFRTKLNGIEVLYDMKLKYKKDNLDYYSCMVTCYENMLHYHFYFVTSNKIYYFNQLGILDYIPNEDNDFKIIYNYEQPYWVKEGVFYQIFPERFYNGNIDNDVLDNEYSFDDHKTIKVKDWNQTPEEYNKTFCLDFYGGDLEGIEKKIPYLKSLGVTALYLNPIFYAATVHKYDCLDYFTIDPHFGGNEALASLTKELHKNGMKLILDVSINHTGIAHKWFNKNGEFFDKSIGAFNNKETKEREYYFFNKDNSYRSWLGVSTLPTLNYTSKELREIIYLGNNSFIRKWLKEPYSIDGWRFDVADIMARNNELQLHHDIWPELRKVIKEENPNAYILAEDWSDCSEFLQGNEWDSSMNYFGFTRPIREFVGEVDLFNKRNKNLNFKVKMKANVLANRIKAHLSHLPFTIQENQFNLIDSHDTSRLHNNSLISFDAYKTAVIAMFTIIGVASIYYGDEACINGTIDSNEGCRYPMPWDTDFQKHKQFLLYKELAHLKQKEEALKYGGMKIISDNDYTLVYARFTIDELIIVILSMEEKDSKVYIPLEIFGKKGLIPSNDLLGENLDFDQIKDKLYLNTKAKKSYIIKF